MFLLALLLGVGLAAAHDIYHEVPYSHHHPIARIGHAAPDFTAKAVLNKQFINVSLSSYKDAGEYVVLLFYPLDFTFVCPTEILAFSDAWERFKEKNANLLAISVDSEYSHLAWLSTPRTQGGLGDGVKIPLVSDLTKSIARSYNVLVEESGVALRGLFIIDQQGILRQITVNDLPVGRSVDETLRLISAFQHADRYGEVCPANWAPGKETMKPNPKGCKEYFNKLIEPEGGL